MELVYPVVRIWKESPTELASALGTLPLAVLATRDGEEAARVLGPALSALPVCPSPAEREIAMSCFLLAGLRFDNEVAVRIFKGIKAMRESSTYRAILEEGEAKGLEKGLDLGLSKGLAEGRSLGRVDEGRRILLRQGSRRFGVPNVATQARVEAIGDLVTLESLLDRVLDATSWSDLLGAER